MKSFVRSTFNLTAKRFEAVFFHQFSCSYDALQLPGVIQNIERDFEGEICLCKHRFSTSKILKGNFYISKKLPSGFLLKS